MKKDRPQSGIRLPMPYAIRAASVTAGLALLAASALAQEVARVDPAPAFVEELTEASATVMDIDAEMRSVSLRTDEGRELTVHVGDDVTSFDELEVGDSVNVEYYEALLANVTTAPPGDGAVLVDSRRAPIGEERGGVVGLVYTAIVTIDDVDTESNTVTFIGPDGEPNEITVERPELQQLVAELDEGDRVQVTYGEALAVSMTPAD